MTEKDKGNDNDYQQSVERIIAVAAALGAAWDKEFDELKAYLAANGGKYPSMGDKDPGTAVMSCWVGLQRKLCEDGRLSLERVARLDEIGFVWTQLDAAWDKKFADLKAFLAENGGYPSTTDKDSATARLGQWVATQRKTKAMLETLHPERVARLVSIGFEYADNAVKKNKEGNDEPAESDSDKGNGNGDEPIA